MIYSNTSELDLFDGTIRILNLDLIKSYDEKLWNDCVKISLSQFLYLPINIQ